jgi:hypothetical protein
MYINAAADSVMFQLRLRHDCDNIIFKIKRKFYIYIYIASGLPHPPQGRIPGAHLSDTNSPGEVYETPNKYLTWNKSENVLLATKSHKLVFLLLDIAFVSKPY